MHCVCRFSEVVWISIMTSQDPAAALTAVLTKANLQDYIKQFQEQGYEVRFEFLFLGFSSMLSWLSFSDLPTIANPDLEKLIPKMAHRQRFRNVYPVRSWTLARFANHALVAGPR